MSESNEESPEKASTELEQAAASPTPESSTIPPTTAWQAIFAPQYNTYYFYNSVTQETTWINPLQQQQPEASTSSTTAPSSSATETSSATGTPVAETESENQVQNEPEEEDTGAQGTATTASAASARYAALQEAALAQGIDPLLAHLDPSLLAPSVPGSSGGGPSGMFFILDLSNDYILIDYIYFLEHRCVLSFPFQQISHHLQQDSMLEPVNSHPLPHVNQVIFPNMSVLNECPNSISMLGNGKRIWLDVVEG